MWLNHQISWASLAPTTAVESVETKVGAIDNLIITRIKPKTIRFLAGLINRIAKCSGDLANGISKAEEIFSEKYLVLCMKLISTFTGVINLFILNINDAL